MKKMSLFVAMVFGLTACNHLPIKTESKTVTPLQEKRIKQITIKSKYQFAETVEKLSHNITSKGMTIFAKIDHQDAAKQVGQTMQPATVIIFGNPKAGTPLMLQEPTFALQLPLKVLVTETNGEVLVSFHDTNAMINDTTIKYSQVENTLANAEKLIIKTVTE